ncbi:MAG: SulP family inorganic anion transporter [Burkholderiaceae bacterium]|nr:SulP family inorganic anion transporter [Burkholderiaceae bacterium]
MRDESPLRRRLARLLGPWVHEVDGETLRADGQAGLLGAVLVLPQGIAFAALAGLPPAMGLAASALPCAVAALAGSSRHVMSGPTNATSLALGAMLLPLAGGDPGQLLPLALALTLGVGLMQIALALARLGALANFISPSVMLGFTTGAAGLIAWYALAGLLGASGRASPLQAWTQGLSWPSIAVGTLTLLLAMAGRRWWRRGPHLLVALAVGGVLGWWLTQHAAAGAPVPLRVGSPPSAWPHWHAPWDDLAVLVAVGSPLLQAALALTIVALGQSMAIAKALASRTGQVLDVNRECLGQGLANLSAGLGSGMVVCGSLNRSMPNLEAGARTPLSAVAATLFLVAMAALGGPLLAWIPLAGVNALLLIAAWSLWDRAAWQRVRTLHRSEFAIALATAFATLTVRLELAVLAGVMLSLVAYLYRTARPALRTMGFDAHHPGRPFVVIDPTPEGTPPPAALPECPQLKLLRMEGSVWFGAVAHVADRLRGLRQRARASPEGQRHLLVMVKSMNTIDLAGADLWDEERARRREIGGDLYFHRPRPQVLAMWQRTGFLDRLGADHVFPGKRSAIATIVPRLDAEVCARCTARVFGECAQRPGGAAAAPAAQPAR